MPDTSQFISRFSAGIHLLDGATGTELRKAGMPENCCAEQWIIDHPQALISLQYAYVDAGSEIVYAPTFLAQPLALKRWGLEHETEEINRKLISLSRTAAPGCLIAGNLTTMTGFADPGSPEAREAYRRQIQGLIGGGADILAAETLTNTEEAVVILSVARELSSPAVMISFTCRDHDRLYSGEQLIDAIQAAEGSGAAAVGVNCVPASKDLPEMIKGLRRITGLPLICKPNAGHPADHRYPVDRYEFRSILSACAENGANLIGGCCGTTPDYIRGLSGICNS